MSKVEVCSMIFIGVPLKLLRSSFFMFYVSGMRRTPIRHALILHLYRASASIHLPSGRHSQLLVTKSERTHNLNFLNKILVTTLFLGL